jgi:hypothetical protein
MFIALRGQDVLAAILGEARVELSDVAHESQQMVEPALAQYFGYGFVTKNCVPHRDACEPVLLHCLVVLSPSFIRVGQEICIDEGEIEFTHQCCHATTVIETTR